MANPVQFISTSPADTVADLRADYQEISGETLAPASPENLLLHTYGYAEMRLRMAIQYVAEQNLVAFAQGPQLELLGQLVGVSRLTQTPARLTVEYVLATPASTVVTVPAGSSILGDGIRFETEAPAQFLPGESTLQVPAIAVVPGESMNGIGVGLLTEPGEPLPSNVPFTVSNITTSSGGSAIEGDKALRERIKLAPERFTVAGPAGAYRFHAFSASPAIADVAVRGQALVADPSTLPPDGPIPGQVWVYPLTRTGLPSAEILELVDAALSPQDVRPLTDQVTVKSPEAIAYAIDVEVRVAAGHIAETVTRDVRVAMEELVGELSQRLGNVVVPSIIICRAQTVPGVASVVLASPVADLELEPWQWAQNTEITVQVTT